MIDTRAPVKVGRLLAMLACTAILLMAAFEMVVTAARNSPCCFDDASFAVVAKNLAQGHGYLLSLDYSNLDHRGTLFAPQLGTGPSTIVVGAAAISLFGATPSAPATGLIAVNLLLLIAWAWVIGRSSGRLIALSYVAAFMVSAVALTAKHHEHWFAFLGEVQSFLLAVVALFVAALGSRTKVNFLIAGLLLGLSVLAKELSTLYVLAFGAVVLGNGVFHSYRSSTSNRAEFLSLLAVAAVGTLLPIGLFELYRMNALGPEGWLANWREHISFVLSQGTGASSSGHLISERSLVIKDRFFVGMPFLLAMTIGGSGLVLWRAKHAQHRVLCSMLLLAFLIHFGYWLFKSNGWPRYALGAILFACAIFPLPMIALEGSVRKVLAPAVMALVIATGWPGLGYYARTYLIPSYSPLHARSAADSQVSVANFLENGKQHGVVYAPWWAHVAAPEYLGTHPGQFTAITAQSTAEGLLLIDKRVPVPQTADYSALAARCHLVRAFDSLYEVHECRAAAAAESVK